MGWIWTLVVMGSLIGAGAIADRRRYRGLPAPTTELSGRAKRNAVRHQRAQVAHLESPAGYSPFTPIGSGGGFGTGGDGSGGG